MIQVHQAWGATSSSFLLAHLLGSCVQDCWKDNAPPKNVLRISITDSPRLSDVEGTESHKLPTHRTIWTHSLSRHYSTWWNSKCLELVKWPGSNHTTELPAGQELSMSVPENAAEHGPQSVVMSNLEWEQTNSSRKPSLSHHHAWLLGHRCHGHTEVSRPALTVSVYQFKEPTSGARWLSR